MNQIERLYEDVMDIFGGVFLSLEPPKNPTGRWFLDAELDDHKVVVEWLPGDAYFGISLSAHDRLYEGYGVKPEFVTRNYYRAYGAVIGLLAFGEQAL